MKLLAFISTLLFSIHSLADQNSCLSKETAISKASAAFVEEYFHSPARTNIFPEEIISFYYEYGVGGLQGVVPTFFEEQYSFQSNSHVFTSSGYSDDLYKDWNVITVHCTGFISAKVYSEHD